MSIVRISHDKEKPYVMINRATLQDDNVSWAAKGLHAYLLSLTDTWEVSVSHLEKVYKGKKKEGGRDHIRNLLKELIEHGYVEAVEKKDMGKFAGLDYIVFESKQAVKITEHKLKKSLPQTPLSGPTCPAPIKTLQTINNDKKEISKKDDTNVTLDRSSHALQSNVSFDPETYILPNGEKLSLKMRRSLAKYSEKDRQKLNSNVAYFNEQVKKGKTWDNPEAYLQSCIKNNYAQSEANSWQNKLYAEFMKEEHKMRNLTILKTIVQMKKNSNEPAESLSFSLPTETFSDALDSFIRNHKDQ